MMNFDANYILIGAAFASLLLVFFKIFFGFLNWYFKIDGDNILKKNLDDIFVKIHEKSFHYIIQWSLSNIFLRIEETFKGKFKVFSLRVYLFFVFINVISLAVAQLSFSYITDKDLISTIYSLFTIFFDAPKAVTVSTFVFGMLAASFDLISLKITLILLKRASHSTSLGKTLLHLLCDTTIATIACFWAICILNMIQPIILDRIEVELGERILNHTLMVLTAPHIYVPLIIVGISTSLPTLCYLFIELICLTLYFLPKRIYDFFVMIIWNIAIDDSSVLTQLGKTLGSVTALIAVTVSFLKALRVF